MRFQCPHCLGIIAIEDTEAGQAVSCGQCTHVVVVPASRVSPGAVIGDFVIQKKLGQGGVGVVYLAQQLSLDRLAALKILNPEFSQDTAYVADFVREARAAAHLNHPNIVQAYAVGEEEGLYYFAMEYVNGSSLKQVLTHSGRMVAERALQITKEVNIALEFAWKQQKLIHRDIKPDNIILTEDGCVKLADLGLARKASDFEGGEEVEVMGTPQYIPPEALLQKPLDNRSDIYSLGATLYHTITGKFPFLGDNPADTARRHLTDKLPPPKTLVPELGENVAKLIEIMLAKRPEHRYMNSSQLDADIALVLAGQMPKHPLHMDAQKPIPVDGLPSKAKGKKLSMTSRKPAGTGSLTGTGSFSTPTTGSITPQAPAAAPAAKDAGMTTKGGGRPAIRLATKASATLGRTTSNLGRTTSNLGGTAEGEAPLEGEVPAENLPPPPKAKKKMTGSQIAILFGLTTLGVLAILGGLLAWQIHEKNKPEEQKFQEWTEKNFGADILAKYQEIKLAAEDKLIEDTYAKRKGMEEQFASRLKDKNDVNVSRLMGKVRAMTDPLVEEKLSEWRKAQFEIEKKEWRAAIIRKEEEDRKIKAKEDAEAAAAAAAAEKAAQEAEKARLEAELLAKLQQLQESSREEAAALAGKGDFVGAGQQFLQLAASPKAEFADWARAKKQSYELAEECRSLICFSNNKLVGQKTYLPISEVQLENGLQKDRDQYVKLTKGLPIKWSVINVSTKAIVLQTSVINKQGDMDKLIGSVDTNQAPPLFMVELAKLAMGITATTPADPKQQLMLACYLVARGKIATFTTARSCLGAASSLPESAVLMTEIGKLEPILKTIQFKEMKGELKLQADKGNLPQAKVIAAQMKALFPDQYAGAEAEIQEMLKNN